MQQSRFAASVVLSGAITLSLFLLMHFLVASQGASPGYDHATPSIRFGPMPEERPVEPPPRPIPPEPPKTLHPPQKPRLVTPVMQQPQPPTPLVSVPRLSLLTTGSGPYLGGPGHHDGAAESGVVPLVRIQPRYPARPAMAKQEGWVELSFTITPTGGVVDVRVTDSHPPRIFDKEAVRALLKWKFKPRVVDGVPVSQRATQRIDFRLNDGG